MNTRPFFAAAGWWAAVGALLAVGSAWAGTTLPWDARAQDGGVLVSVGLDRAPGTATSPEDAVLGPGRPLGLSLRLSDATSGTPLRGVRTRAWLARQGADGTEACTDQIRRFAAGRLSTRADVDFNGQRLLTLNGDATLSVINPQLSVGTTRLEALVTLPGVGADWALLRNGERVLVTLPAERQLVVVDLLARKVVQRIDLGSGAPRRLVLSPDERQVFVALDDTRDLVVVDLAQSRVVARLDIGAGVHQLALADDGRRLVATAAQGGRVTVVDTAALRVLASHAVQGTPLAVTASARSGKVYVARANADRLAVFDAASGRMEADRPFARGVTALRADPSGRWVVGVSGRDSRLHVLDTVNGRLVGSAATVEQPDQVAFTARFAYVRGLSSLSVTMLDLAGLSRGDLATSQVPMFQRRPDAAASDIGVADMIVPAPDGDGVLVANGADPAVYAYMEGMQAPQGSYRTYSRAARALMAVDRSLRESAPGEFSTRFALDRGGRYTLAVLVDQPRVLRCFEIEADDRGLVADGRRLGVRIEVAEGGPVRAGQPQWLRVRLADEATGQPVTGLKDVQLMALEMPGLSQRRRFAEEEAPGVYRVSETFPRPGAWQLQVQVASQGLGFEQTRPLDLTVTPAAAAP